MRNALRNALKNALGNGKKLIILKIRDILVELVCMPLCEGELGGMVKLRLINKE